MDVLPVSYAFSFRIRKSLPQTGEDAASCVDLAEAFPGDAEVAFGFAAAFGGWVADGGSDEAFALPPLRGRVCGYCSVAMKAFISRSTSASFDLKTKWSACGKSTTWAVGLAA